MPLKFEKPESVLDYPEQQPQAPNTSQGIYPAIAVGGGISKLAPPQKTHLAEKKKTVFESMEDTVKTAYHKLFK